MIARLTAYRPASDVEALREEVTALARASWPMERTARRVEFFFVDTATGAGLSVVFGVDRTVVPVIAVEGASRSDSQEYDVHRLQVGPPSTSDFVDALFARVV